MLLAFDLDKTLLTDDYQLPTRIADSVLKARSAGHLVTVLTGRPLLAATDYLDQLAIDTPHSVNHGSLIRDPAGAVMRRKRLTADDVDGLIVQHLDDHLIEFTCVVDEKLFVRDPANERWNWVHASSRKLEQFAPGMRLDADKVVFHGNGRSEGLEKLVARSYPRLLRYLWGDGYLEIVPEGGDKGSALAYIAETLGVARSDVIAFGDGLNDVSMLAWAGRAVAVGPDAHEDALALADEHIASPEEGGVADWLDQNLL